MFQSAWGFGFWVPEALARAVVFAPLELVVLGCLVLGKTASGSPLLDILDPFFG